MIRYQKLLQILMFGIAVMCASFAQAEEEKKGHEAKQAPAAAARPVPAQAPAMSRTMQGGGVGQPHGAVQDNRGDGRREGDRREGERDHRDGGRDYREGERHEFHDHDFHRFSYEERTVWQGGRWNNTCYGGRCGWWWFAGGQWYYYNSPVYPYPVVVADFSYAEPVVVAPAPYVPQPVVQAPPAVLYVAPPPQFWYYCDNPAGYYPNVATCNTQFREVAAPPAPR